MKEKKELIYEGLKRTREHLLRGVAFLIGFVAIVILLFIGIILMNEVNTIKENTKKYYYNAPVTMSGEFITEERKELFEEDHMLYKKIEKEHNDKIAENSELHKLKEFCDFHQNFWEVRKDSVVPEEQKILKHLYAPIEYNPLEDKKKIKKMKKFRVGYITDVVNIRKKPSKKSKSLGLFLWNDEIIYKYYNDKWAYVCYGNNYAYVSLKYIQNKPFSYEEYDTVYEHQKSFMDYRKITLRSSKQYKLENNGYVYTGRYGIRMMNGRYLCAIGTYYSEDVGRYVDLVLENGVIIPCILGDIKANKDTDSTNRYTVHDHSVVEFIVDTPYLNSKIRRTGNLNYANEKWNSSIVSIRVYKKRV